MAKIRIKSLPKALSGLEIKMRPGLYGTNGNRQFSLPTQIDSQKYAEPDVKVGGVLGPVPREEANLEAEKGETAVVNINGIPAHFTIGGKRHSEGGTPLNLPDNSFIFSDTAKMKIKHPEILKQFGMSMKKGGYTPADIAKKYDINKYRKILADKESDDLQKKTAEMMIANYNEKLAKLALAQESIKGFPQGIPVIAMPYIIANDIDPAQFVPTQSQEEEPDADTGVSRFGSQVISKWNTKKYGGLRKAQFGTPSFDEFKHKITNPGEEYSSKRPGVYQQVQDAMQSIPKKDYVKKGWSGDPQAEEDFAQDPETKISYDMYKNAMLKKDSDPSKKALLMSTKAELQKKDVSGWSWLPGKQNKISEMINILDEEYLRLTNPKAYEEKYFKKPDSKIREQLDKDLRNQVKSLYNTVYFIKTKSKDPIRASQAEDDLKILADLHPDYRKDNPWETSMVDKDKFPWKMRSEPIYYNDNEYLVIKDFLEKYPITLESAAESLKAKKIKSVKDKKEDPFQAEKDKLKAMNFDWTNPSQEHLDEIAKDPKLQSYLEKLYNRPEYKGMKEALFEQAYGGSIYKSGGVLLPKAKNGEESQNGKGFVRKKTSEAKNSTTSGVSGSGTPEQPYTPAQAYDKIGVDNLNKLRKQFNLDPIPYGNPTDPAYQQKVKEAAGEMQAKASEEYPALIKDYMINKNITPTAALSNILGPRGYGKKVGNRYKLTPADLQKAIKEGNVTDDEILQGYQDKLWHYRGLTLDKKKLSKAEYEKKMKEASVDIDGRRFFSDDPNAPYKYTEYEMEEAPQEKKDIKTKEKEKETADRGDVRRNTPVNLGQGAYAPWWLQDIIGTAGAYGDLARIRRYQPWQATPQIYLPEMVPYDPTRELAANAEQANIAMQAQQAFTGPQQLAAASAVTQGKALANAADIMGRYNNLNVGLANQLEKERANLLNQASQQRSALDTQLWDKYTIANQQFDNSKALARQELRKNVINAVTNRAKTQAMNTLYPDYYTDPSTGGFVQFRPGYTPTPTTPSDNIDALWKKAKELNPNDPASIFKVLYNKKDSDEETTLPYQGYPG